MSTVDHPPSTTAAKLQKTQTTITSLPAELLALVAIQADVLSLLELSRTSRSIRHAVFNNAVAREVLFSRHDGYPWATTSWDTAALSRRADGDVHVWLRYALAVERANQAMLADPISAGQALKWSWWIAELALLKHPLFYHPSCLSNRESAPTLETQFASVVSELCATEVHRNMSRHREGGGAADDGWNRLIASPFWRADVRACTHGTTGQQETLHLVTTLSALLTRRHELRRSVWPYGQHAIVPDIQQPVPSKMQLYMNALPGAELDLPVPFARSRSMPRTENFPDWYNQQCEALAQSPDYLFEGEWQGYYSIQDEFPDPPMVEIKFRHWEDDRAPITQRARPSDTRTHIHAHDCRDAVDSFNLHGFVEKIADTKEVRLVMEKRYRSGLRWAWNCKLMPFGIVGHWGDYGAPAHRFQHGTVWLWKREWSKEG